MLLLMMAAAAADPKSFTTIDTGIAIATFSLTTSYKTIDDRSIHWKQLHARFNWQLSSKNLDACLAAYLLACLHSYSFKRDFQWRLLCARAWPRPQHRLPARQQQHPCSGADTMATAQKSDIITRKKLIDS